jgi:hypothetical protein
MKDHFGTTFSYNCLERGKIANVAIATVDVLAEIQQFKVRGSCERRQRDTDDLGTSSGKHKGKP